jgi:hypothetical protein
MKVEEIISLFPEQELDFLSAETKVDHQVKKLQGALVFKLILFSMLNSTKLSLRVMESFLASAQFKTFAQSHEVNAKYNSLRDRISTIKSEYFEKIFELLFEKYNRFLKEEKAISIMDSTFINISSKLVQWGMENGTRGLGLKFMKFTVSMKGSLPCNVRVYREQDFINDNIAFPDAIFKNKFLDNSILVFDRGLQTRKVFNEMSDKNILFVGRIKTDVSYKQIRKIKLPKPDKNSTVELTEDIEVHLVSGYHYQFTSNSFRLIKARIKSSGETIFFITNYFDASAYEIAAMYKQRWEIEIFFKFLKQHLNLKHIISRNDNAIQVMIYMTLILATLLIVYKKKNKISGYKIAKLKFEIELDNFLIKEIVLLCGGDPTKAAYLWSPP